MKMDDKWVEWAEPYGPNSEPRFCQVSKTTAVAVARAAAAQKGHQYATDEDALLDFVIVHWAIEVER